MIYLLAHEGVNLLVASLFVSLAVAPINSATMMLRNLARFIARKSVVDNLFTFGYVLR